MYYRPISDHLALTPESWKAARSAISQKLSSTKVLFSNFSSKSGIVKIGFNDQDSMNVAETSLQGVLCNTELWSYEKFTPARQLPKLTVFNVPLDFIDLEETTGTDFNPTYIEQRDAAKSQIVSSIMSKNDEIKDLVTGGSILDVIFFQKHKYTCTVGLKVSPDIRSHILENCNSKLFIFTSRCEVKDRCFYKQCFYCQRHGHIANDCHAKARNDPPKCMYCAGNHATKNCSVKNQPNMHVCANCVGSKNLEISSNANSHNASSPICPASIKLMKRVVNSTDYNIGKN